MTIFVLTCLLALTLAEPPVGNGYASARTNHKHDSYEGLSQEYGVPGLGARSQNDYASVDAASQSSYIPSTRTGLSQEYGSPSRSISQEYGAPSLRSKISNEYGLPASRSSVSKEYGVPNVRGLSQQYGVPNARGVSQEYGVPSSRSLSQQYGAPNTRGLSQKYGAPTGRGLSQQYGAPNTRALSQQYGAPSSRGLSQQYGAPSSRNVLDTGYATPSGRSQNYSPSARFSQGYNAPQLRSGSQDYKTIADVPSDSYGTPLQKSPSATYGEPDFRSTPSEEYGVPAQRNFEQTSKQHTHNAFNSQGFHSASQSSIASARQNKPLTSQRSFQNSFGIKSSSYTSDTFHAPSSSYGTPSARITDSYSPSSRTVSQTYGSPSERSLSSEYGAPEARTNFKSNSYDTARSVPSIQYGQPSARDAMPSDQYGVPEQYDSLSTQGYNYARNALDELLNQEPANYNFGYKVNDYASGSDFGHTESRQDDKAEGSYFVVLPDGTKQTVEYEADERGFKPRISVESAETRAGYDDNAADLARSAGPY